MRDALDAFCSMLQARIEPTKFRTNGMEVEWLEEPSQADLDAVAYVQANYDFLVAEYAAAKVESERQRAIKTQLSVIDQKRIRPVAAIAAAQTLGQTPSQADIDVLTALEIEADILRGQL